MRIEAAEAEAVLDLLDHAILGVAHVGSILTSADGRAGALARVHVFERLRADLRIAVASSSGRVRFFEFDLRGLLKRESDRNASTHGVS